VKKENAEKLLKELETSPIKCAIIGEVCKKSDSYLVVE
jgi:hydrogenase maturation factor